MATLEPADDGAEIHDTHPAPALHADVTAVNTALAAQHRAVVAAATADNTRRAYRSAVNHYLAWGGVMPSDEAAIIRYLLIYAPILNPRTLALRLTALSQWHVHQGFPDPASTPTVRKTLTGIARTHGRPKKKAKALPIEDLERIVAKLASAGTLKAARDNALLQIGFFGGFRRSELVAIEVEHIVWAPEGIEIMLPRSKTDQLGEGIVKAIPYSDGPCCPATALRAWLDVAGIPAGPVFRSITKWGVVAGTALGVGSVNTILEDCATLAQLDYVPDLSSHSLRRGMATSAHTAPAPTSATSRSKAAGATTGRCRATSRRQAGSRRTRPAVCCARGSNRLIWLSAHCVPTFFIGE